MSGVGVGAGVRMRIIGAFNRLFLARRDERPKVAELLAEAGVARATFYSHFNGRDDLLLAALEGPMSTIADAAAGRGDRAAVAATLEHFRDRRREAIELLGAPLGPRVVRMLGGLIALRLEQARSAASDGMHLAELETGLIRLWLSGETRHTPSSLADLMIRSADAYRSVLADCLSDRPPTMYGDRSAGGGGA